MSYELINLTLPVVLAQIEKLLDDYPEYPYQIAFSLPELRQRLLDHVLTHTPNHYSVAGEKLTLKSRNSLAHSSVQERIRMENLIHGSILHILRENTEWVGCQIVNTDITANKHARSTVSTRPATGEHRGTC